MDLKFGDIVYLDTRSPEKMGILVSEASVPTGRRGRIRADFWVYYPDENEYYWISDLDKYVKLGEISPLERLFYGL